MTNQDKANEIAQRSDFTTNARDIDIAFKAAMKMAQWKDEQFIETAQEDAENYVKGVAKANPDLSVCVLNLLETAYIAGRNKIK